MIKLENATYEVIKNNIKNFKYVIYVEGLFEGSVHGMELWWKPGYNEPESVLKLAKAICGES